MQKTKKIIQKTLILGLFGLSIGYQAFAADVIIATTTNNINPNNLPSFLNILVDTATNTNQNIPTTTASTTNNSKKNTFKEIEVYESYADYVQIFNSCNHGWANSACVNARSGPGKKYDKIMKLRNGMVLKVSEKVVIGKETWYKISFDEWLRYPERMKTDFYVNGDYVKFLPNIKMEEIAPGYEIPMSKHIDIDLKKQTLTAYDGEKVFMKTKISSGKKETPTATGTFYIFRKVPTRYMQGPIPGVSEKEYDLPGVPWNMYFKRTGEVIHGAYWHNSYGTPVSNGCANVPLDKARELYDWGEVGMVVTVK